MKDWDALQPLLIQTLSPPTTKVRAKIELDGTRQGTEESILDFLERLQTLVDQCYDKPNELAAKEFLLKDLFMRGLRDERVSIAVLTECDSLDLQDLVKLTQKHELAVEALTLSKKPTKGEEMVSVLPVAENQAFPLPQNGNMYVKRCHGSGSTDHLVKECPLKMQNPFNMGTPIRSKNIQWKNRSKLSCWHCGGSHMKRDCFQLKRNNERPGWATNGYRPKLLNREARYRPQRSRSYQKAPRYGHSNGNSRQWRAPGQPYNNSRPQKVRTQRPMQTAVNSVLPAIPESSKELEVENLLGEIYNMKIDDPEDLN